MSLSTVVLTFFAVMEAGELQRRSRQWPYLAAALILILLALSRLYLGMEWLSGALMGIAMGLAWTAVVGIAYRQRAIKRFSGATASLIFYGSLFALFAWQVNEHAREDLTSLHTAMVVKNVDRNTWWDSRWREMSTDRTQLKSVASRKFNAQIAADPERRLAWFQTEGGLRWRGFSNHKFAGIAVPIGAPSPLILRLIEGQ